MNTNRSILLKSLANTISDYRQRDIPSITPIHVERWLKQFDFADQPIILAELDSIMKRFYFSRLRVKECVRTFLRDTIIGAHDPIKLLPHVSFLNIQAPGNSQGAMLDIVDEVLLQEYGFSLALTGTGEVQTYIYIDDGIYTGNTLRYDLTSGVGTTGWLSNCPSSQCTLWVYTIAGHRTGISYARRYIQDTAEEKQIKVKRETTLLINDVRSSNSDIEVLWPENSHGDSYIDAYISNLQVSLGKNDTTNNLFRHTGIILQEKLFSSLEARRVVEKAFLKKGIQIIKVGKSSASSIRPLGFMKLVSLGFGTFFVTYRNIANNCPLVLWWGDPDFPATHPLGIWYPLLPRRTNEQRSIIKSEQIFDEHPF